MSLSDLIRMNDDILAEPPSALLRTQRPSQSNPMSLTGAYQHFNPPPTLPWMNTASNRAISVLETSLHAGRFQQPELTSCQTSSSQLWAPRLNTGDKIAGCAPSRQVRRVHCRSCTLEGIEADYHPCRVCGFFFFCQSCAKMGRHPHAFQAMHRGDINYGLAECDACVVLGGMYVHRWEWFDRRGEMEGWQSLPFRWY